MASSMSAYFFTIAPKSHSMSISISHQSFKPSQYHYCTLRSVILPQSAKFRCGRTSVSLIRASSSSSSSSNVVVTTASSIRPGGSVESDKLPSNVRKRAMDAIDSNGRRVTIGDVASKAGLNLNEAQKALQALASDANGFLEVSDEGDVLYVFPTDYRLKLNAKSFRMKLEPWLEKGKIAAEYLVRISFGTTLIASIILVYTTIIALASTSRGSNDRGRRGRSYDSGFTFYVNPVDLFWYWDPYYNRRRRVRRKVDDRVTFIDIVTSQIFSFVFGDGDPNQGLEEERWQLIGKYITSNGGVVAAEELAPYLDLETTKMGDDSYILPVLIQFDGQPEVNEEGNILYRFPSLQRTAVSKRSGRKEYVGKRLAGWFGDTEKFFKEKKWKFSKIRASQRAMVIGLGGVNLIGVIILSTLLKDATVNQSGFISFVSEVFPMLQIYAGSFFAIPLIRWFFIQNKNSKIVKRNNARKQLARALESPNLSLRRKLLSAREMAQRTVIGKDRIVYSTGRDFNEQDYETQEWDRRFKELEKSD